MTHMLRRPILSAVCVLATTQVAQADITAEDVWANLEAYVGALGGKLDGIVEGFGDDTHVTAIETSFTLPFDMGSVKITQNDLTLRDAGDGTIHIIYPDEIKYEFVADIADEGVFTGTFLMGHTNLVTKASGNPGQILYEYTADAITGTLSDFSMPEADDVENLQATLDLQLKDMQGGTSLIETDLFWVGGSVRMADQSFNLNWTATVDGSVMSGTNQTSVQSTNSRASLKIPVGEVSILNLAAAIRAGLEIEAESETTGYSSSQSQTMDGQPLMQQTTGQAESNTRLTLDESGVKISGAGTGFFADFLIPDMLPFPVRMEGDAVTAKLEMPLAANEAPQRYALGLSMEGVTISDQVWALFDPTAALPRDPALVDLDLTGTLRNKMDLLDFAAMAGLSGDDLPLEALSADLNKLSISAAGVSLDAAGALTFDNEDTASYGGMPKPVGEIGATLKGANGLMEKLVTMGLMSEQDVAGARMGIAMVARPEGDPADDTLVSKFVFGEDGSISANGMQLK